jgi:uncharacterized protein
MFDLLLLNLKSQGLRVGMSEWLTFLSGIEKGLVVDLEGLYGFGRAVLCTSESWYDAWDLAFTATFQGVELPPVLKDELLAWLADAKVPSEGRTPVDMDLDEMRRRFLERLREQKERHDGGSKWIGTKGKSPFGSGGVAETGIRVGPGGGRSAVEVAGDRAWKNYRTDERLETRDLRVALKALRNLAREGRPELDVKRTIRRTADNAGDIDLVFRPGKRNRVHLVLLMDSGGSMEPHTRLVEQLFTAAKEAKGFKSFQALSFHNVPYGWLYRDYESYDRVRVEELLREWTPSHRLVWVGDASMAPWELFSAGYHDWTGKGGATASGLDWLKRIHEHCPASVWLNPDPERFWVHSTVSAVQAVFPMFPLTLGGLRDAVRKLKAA